MMTSWTMMTALYQLRHVSDKASIDEMVKFLFQSKKPSSHKNHSKSLINIHPTTYRKTCIEINMPKLTQPKEEAFLIRELINSCDKENTHLVTDEFPVMNCKL